MAERAEQTPETSAVPVRKFYGTPRASAEELLLDQDVFSEFLAGPVQAVEAEGSSELAEVQAVLEVSGYVKEEIPGGELLPAATATTDPEEGPSGYDPPRLAETRTRTRAPRALGPRLKKAKHMRPRSKDVHRRKKRPAKFW